MKKMFAIGMAVVILMGLIHFGLNHNKQYEIYDELVEIVENDIQAKNGLNDYKITEIELGDDGRIIYYWTIDKDHYGKSYVDLESVISE